jgi:hypothetical protein
MRTKKKGGKTVRKRPQGASVRKATAKPGATSKAAAPSAPPAAGPPATELAVQKREFIETFFKRGEAFAEELIHENERLRFRVAELEGITAVKKKEPRTPGHALDPSTMRMRLDELEQEREALLQSIHGVEALNQDYLSRYHEIERENNNLANLYVASHQLHSTLELREVTHIIVEILLNFIGAKTFAIQLVDEEHGRLRTLVAEGAERARVPERSLEAADNPSDAMSGPLGEALRTGRPSYAEGPLLPRPLSAPPAIAVPLKLGDKVVGLILVWELLAQKPGLVDVDFELFNLLGDHAGAALQSAKLHTELQGRPPALWVAADLV